VNKFGASMASDPAAVMMRLHCVREGTEQKTGRVNTGTQRVTPSGASFDELVDLPRHG